jgi:hypothetical protein
MISHSLVRLLKSQLCSNKLRICFLVLRLSLNIHLQFFSKHEKLLEYILYPSPMRIPMACNKVDKEPEYP